MAGNIDKDIPQSHELDFGITCIDADYIRPGLACFYLMEESGECAVIETGTSRSFGNLCRLLEDRGILPEQVRYVIPTHVHLDHAGGAGTMMAAFPEARLLIHPRGASHMADPQRLIESSEGVYGLQRFRELYGEITPIDSRRMVIMEDGDTVELGGRKLHVRHTRGHANHHFCLWDETSSGWFSGDMFGISYPWFRFAGGDYMLPATTPTQFDPQAYIASLELLASYQPLRIYLTHYGELAYAAGKAQQLSQQLLAYTDLATTLTADHDALVSALSDYSVARVREIDNQLPEDELRELLAFDIDLNARGLRVWQQRQAAA